MDMDSRKTDRLIAGAIAALPYRRPSAGFSARVMAGIAAEAPQPWLTGVLKGAGLIVTAWAAALAFVSARLVYANFADTAALLIQPGGLGQALNLLAARAALVLAKAGSVMSLGLDILSAAAAGLPAWYEIAVAAAVCSAAIAALSHGGRFARQGI
ncbi:MAG: hypothetical protein Q7R35_10845 [Elusimicrobiota bacterium]|nr:hypothetical protein [Elusimicrobiota bacterium]